MIALDILLRSDIMANAAPQVRGACSFKRLEEATMPVAEKIAALMEQLTQAEVEAMAPAMRERFAFLCSRWANVARVRHQDGPKAGVLADLRRGLRHE
jgi:hypothetical protein